MKKLIVLSISILLCVFTLWIISISVAFAIAEETVYEYYYNALTVDQKAIYNEILTLSPDNGNLVGVVSYTGSDEEQAREDLYIARTAVLYDHPEVRAWLILASLEQLDTQQKQLSFTCMTETYYNSELQAKTNELISAIAANVDLSWNNYTKALYIYNAVISNMSYDGHYGLYDASGVATYRIYSIQSITTGVSVCSGNAQIYKAIADKVGLPCVVVESYTHAWNHVMMDDGNWYGVCTTNGYFLLGKNNMVGRSFDYKYGSEKADMYKLYDGYLDFLNRPERAPDDYVYTGESVYIPTIDLTPLRTFSNDELRFTYLMNDDNTSCTITGYTGNVEGDLVIPETIDGLIVTRIGEGAFAYAQFNGALSLPRTVEVIEKEAFLYCNRLHGQLILPDSLREIGGCAFLNCEMLSGEIVFNDSLQVIGNNAFASCARLSGSLLFPDSIIMVGKDAFYRCFGLDGVVRIPEKMEEWNSDCIDECRNLKSFTVSPNNQAFCDYQGILYSKDMTTLVTCLSTYKGAVIIPEGVTSIGYMALYMCEGITSIHLPSTLKRIENWGCGFLSGLMDPIEFPAALEYIGECAFSSASIMGILSYPSGIEIGRSAFQSVKNMTEVIVPEGVTNIPNRCFWGAIDLKRIWLPSSLQSIGSDAFHNVYNLEIHGYSGSVAQDYVDNYRDQFGCTFVLNEWTYSLSEYEAHLAMSLGGLNTIQQMEINIIPEYSGTVQWVTLDNTVVTVQNGIISPHSEGNTEVIAIFADHELRCSVTVEKSLVMSQDGKTLESCSKYYQGELFVPDGVEVINDFAFQECKDITSIIVPDSVMSIGWRSFAYCSRLMNIQLPANIKVISMEAFSSCTQLREIVIPEGVEIIRGNAFSECRNLSKITLPMSLKSIQQGAFYFCKMISEIDLPAGLEQLGQSAFMLCSGLTELTIPEGVTAIEPYTFYGCISLSSITFPEGIVRIGDRAFSEMNALSLVKYGGTVEEWNWIHIGSDNTQLTKATIDCKIKTTSSLNLPAHLTVVEESAFEDVPAEIIVFSNEVKRIEYRAFAGCSNLKLVYIPDGMQFIDSNAFVGCENLVFMCESDNIGAEFARENGIAYRIK